MWEYLSSRPIWEILATLVGMASSVWLLGLAIVYVIRKGNIKKVGADGVEVSDGIVAKPLTKHAECLHSRDIVLTLRRQADMINRCRDIRDSVLPEQMKYAESRYMEIKGLMQKIFLQLLEENAVQDGIDVGNIVSSEDYHLFRLCMRSIYEDLRDYVRACFRENHLASKIEDEFRIYSGLKADELIQKASDMLNDLYRGTTVSRTHFHEEIKTVLPEIKKIIEDMFRHARSVSARSATEIERLMGEFDDYFRATIM